VGTAFWTTKNLDPVQEGGTFGKKKKGPRDARPATGKVWGHDGGKKTGRTHMRFWFPCELVKSRGAVKRAKGVASSREGSWARPPIREKD